MSIWLPGVLLTYVAFLLAAASPGPNVLAWIAMVSLGMSEGAPTGVPIAIVLGTFTLSILLHVGYAIGFSTPVMLRLHRRARRGLRTAFGVFFVYAGGRLLTDRPGP